jgi:hypothetical protein
MTVLQYQFPPTATTPTRRRRLTGLGTAHAGPRHTPAVRSLGATIASAREAAPVRRAPSAERLADALIDSVDNLAASDRAVLGVVIGALLRNQDDTTHTPNRN